MSRKTKAITFRDFGFVAALPLSEDIFGFVRIEHDDAKFGYTEQRPGPNRRI